MPFRLHEGRYIKTQFTAPASMPSQIRQAAAKTGKVSNTQYIQHVLAEALARDLDLPLQELLDGLPPSRSAVPAFIEDGTRHTHRSTNVTK